MTFKLPTSPEKADYVREQFERIANGYDLTNDVISMGMHRFWKKRAVKELVRSAQNSQELDGKYLDVCCGTGDLALIMAGELMPGGEVVGLDFSKNMLSIACQRAKLVESAGALKSMVAFVEGDAQNLPFADDTFDGAIISFGLRNLTDLQRGLNEMTRVVRPGGRVINLDLGHSNVPLFAPLFHFYFRQVVPILGHFLQGDRKAYTYLPESLSTYPKPERISEMFRQAGLLDVRHVPLALGSVAMHVGVKARAGKA